MKKIKFWQLIAVLLGTALVAAIAVAVTLLVGRTSNKTELPVIDNNFAEIESSETLETNFVEESMPEPVASEQETELISTEDEQSSEVETSVVSNTTDEKSSVVSGTIESEPVRPSQNQSVQTQPSQNQPSTSNSAQTQPSQNQQTQTQPSQTTQPEQTTTPQVLIPVGVAIAQTEGGKATVNGQDKAVIWRGMSVTLVAEPEKGYEFEMWYVNGQPYSNLNPALITPVQDAGVLPIYKKVVPPSKDNGNGAGNNNGNGGSNGSNSSSDDKPQQKPNKKSYTVKVEQAEGGSATVDGKTKKSFKNGQTAKLKAKANKGYVFDGWEINGKKVVSKDNPYNYKVTENATVTPIFKEVYRLRVAVENVGGTIKVTENDEILLKEIRNYQYADIVAGRRVTVTATPFEGNNLKCWIVDSKEIPSKSNTYTFTASADVDVVAVFEKAPAEQVTLKVAIKGGKGTAKIDGRPATQKTVSAGTEVTAEVEPDEGFHFVKWEEVSDTSNPLTLTVNETMTLTAVLEKDAEQEMKTLTITTEGSGYILMDDVRKNKVTLPKGTTVEAEAMAYEGSKFDSWSDGVKTNSRKITLNTNITLGAKFVETSSKPEDTATVTLAVKSGKGTVAMNGKTGTRWTVEKGTEVSFTQKPAEGYLFGGWGEDKDMSETHKIVVNDDMEISVYFDETVEITLSAQEGGSLTFDGQTVTTEETFVVRKGSQMPVTINPEKDYRFSGWDGDAANYFEETASSGTIKADDNLSLMAKFEKRTEYTVTLIQEGGDGDVTFEGKSVVFVDGKATVKATAREYTLAVSPKKGFQFANWKNSFGIIESTELTYTFRVSGDTTISINFVKEEEKAVHYSVKGRIFHTDYVAPGSAPEVFYSSGLGGFENDEFDGWLLNNKLYSGKVGADDFICSEHNESLKDDIKKATQSGDVTLIASFRAKVAYCNLSYPEYVEVVGSYETITEGDLVKYRKGIDIQLKVKESFGGEEGKPYFDHWEVNRREVGGQNRNQMFFTINEDSIVTAVWSATTVKPTPKVSMTEGWLNETDNMRIYGITVSANIPNGFVVNEIGVLGSLRPVKGEEPVVPTDEEMNFDSGKAFVRISQSVTSSNDSIDYSPTYIGAKDWVEAGTVMKLKPYIIVSDVSGEETYYGSVVEYDFSAYKDDEKEEIQLLSEEVELTEEISEEESTSEEISETEEVSEEETTSEETSEEDDSETEETSETTDTATEENSETVESTTEETTETSEPDSTPVTTEEETETESSITVETSEPVADSSESEETVQEEDSSTEEESEEQSEPEDGKTETVNIEAIVEDNKSSNDN